MPKYVHPNTQHLPPIEQIAKEYLGGMSSQEIAEKYRVSPAAILSRLRKAGVPRRSGADAHKLAVERGRKTTTAYWTGKRMPAEMVEKRAAKMRGPNHYAWKGGKDQREYRREVQKEKCEDCGSRQNLGIHHKDFDHYNNDPDNLQVLCVSCHSRLHKQAYWDSLKNGETPKKGNGPVGWDK